MNSDMQMSDRELTIVRTAAALANMTTGGYIKHVVLEAAKATIRVICGVTGPADLTEGPLALSRPEEEPEEGSATTPDPSLSQHPAAVASRESLRRRRAGVSPAGNRRSCGISNVLIQR